MRISPLYNQLSALSFGKAVVRSLQNARAVDAASNREPDADATAAHQVAQAHALVNKLRTYVASSAQNAASEDDLAAATAAARSAPAAVRGTTRSYLTGVNSEQVARVQFYSGQRNSALHLQGAVTESARAARLTVVGGSGAKVVATGEFELSGNKGSIALSMKAGESLQNVASRVNLETANTGVTAAVSGDRLVLSSTDIGATAEVRLTPVNVREDSTSGVNAAQVAHFTASAQVIGETEEISGNVVSTAAAAELTYQGGVGGTVVGSATFRLTGASGAANFAVSAGESLADVAERVNENTAATGVVAAFDGENLRLTSAAAGADAFVRVDEVVREETVTVSGENASQIQNFTVSALETETTHVISGQVTRAAAQASLTLQGQSGAVVDSAQFELVGTLGTANISITAGESLSAVADRINAETGNTGVTATAQGSQLLLNSVQLGSAASVEVHLVDVDYHTQVSGVNASQITSFSVDSIDPGASESISGSVTQQATKATLSFTGLAGLVGTVSNFTLTGSLGSRTFSTSIAQTLSSLASSVNAQSANTGVTATVVGSRIDFKSTGVGSSATVNVHVNSGVFNVLGGNGSGSATGTNAQATINGQAITATTPTTFQYSTANASYTFTVASNFTGALSTVSVASVQGDFNLSGGDGNGAAQGLDALAEINGVEVSGAGNHFAVDDNGSSFNFDVADGFTGVFDSVTVRSELANFTVAGGDETGTAHGADFVALVGGVEFRNTTNHATHTGEFGTYDLDFVAGFSGQFDTITVTKGGTATLEDADENGRALGRNLAATINGVERSGSLQEVRLVENGLEVLVEFQAGFTGQFDTISIHRFTSPDSSEDSTNAETVTEEASDAVPEPSGTAAAVAATLADIAALTARPHEGAPEPSGAEGAPASVTLSTGSLSELTKTLAPASVLTRAAALQSLSDSAQQLQQRLVLDLLG